MDTIQITPADGGEHLLVVTDVVTIKASGQHTSGDLLMIEVIVPPGGGPPALHRHTSSEIFYLLEGEFEVSTIDTSNALSKTKVRAGDTLSIPSMVWHNFKNVGATSGKFLAIHSPAGMEAFAREIGRPIDAPNNPPQPAGPPSDEQRQRMMSIIEKYMDVLPLDKIQG